MAEFVVSARGRGLIRPKSYPPVLLFAEKYKIRSGARSESKKGHNKHCAARRAAAQHCGMEKAGDDGYARLEKAILRPQEPARPQDAVVWWWQVTAALINAVVAWWMHLGAFHRRQRKEPCC